LFARKNNNSLPVGNQGSIHKVVMGTVDLAQRFTPLFTRLDPRSCSGKVGYVRQQPIRDRACFMRNLQDFRKRKPTYYPDQAIYAEYASTALGLAFEDLNGGTGLIFKISSGTRSHCFAGGRGSFFPQNNATSATLANDKYFTNVILDRSGIPNLGGDYFFLHRRHRANRAPGHERDDALPYLATLGGRAFVKPLYGSRGDFAEIVNGATSLAVYMESVSQTYDSILIQPVVTGNEFRIFLLDDDIVYVTQKHAPFIVGDGVRSISQLLAAHNAGLEARGVSALAHPVLPGAPDTILAKGERCVLSGRMNRGAGGTMSFTLPRNEQAAVALARGTARALGLRAAAVDMFTDVDGDPNAMRVIEVNANPSIRVLEDHDRADLILKIWRHTFSAIGLLGV
jgi:hypothetical protein